VSAASLEDVHVMAVVVEAEDVDYSLRISIDSFGGKVESKEDFQ
jgi:ATP-dependent protease ClpP protease subunit